MFASYGGAAQGHRGHQGLLFGSAAGRRPGHERRGRASIKDGPRSPASITTLLSELGDKFPGTPGMHRLIDLVYELWAHPNVHHVNGDWIEFIWEGGEDQ